MKNVSSEVSYHTIPYPLPPEPPVLIPTPLRSHSVPRTPTHFPFPISHFHFPSLIFLLPHLSYSPLPSHSAKWGLFGGGETQPFPPPSPTPFLFPLFPLSPTTPQNPQNPTKPHKYPKTTKSISSLFSLPLPHPLPPFRRNEKGKKKQKKKTVEKQ